MSTWVDLKSIPGAAGKELSPARRFARTQLERFAREEAPGKALKMEGFTCTQSQLCSALRTELFHMEGMDGVKPHQKAGEVYLWRDKRPGRYVAPPRYPDK